MIAWPPVRPMYPARGGGRLSETSSASGPERSTLARARRWLVGWLVLAALLALAVLVNAVRDYLFVWRILAAQQMRHHMAEYVASLEQALRRPTAPAMVPAELLAVPTEPTIDATWVEVRQLDGTVVARRGAAQGPTFRRDEEVIHFRNHEPLFRIVDSPAGDLVVQAFPVYALPRPPEAAAPPPAPSPPRAGPRSLVIVEVAAPLTIRDASSLWPTRRNLLVDSAGAIALLATVVIAGLGFRSYERGQRLEAQLEIARQVQAELLPARTGGWEEPVRLAAAYRPAEQVGGDFWDAFRPGDGRVALVIGDVSGKGVPAALLTGVIHGAVRSAAWWESAASHELESAQLNRLLCRDAAPNRYASMFWCYYEPGTRELRYVNDGHCPPLLVSRGPDGLEVSTLDAGGPVLGLVDDAAYRQASRHVAVGDLLILYSDGLVESTNTAGEEYGVGRLRELLPSAAASGPEGLRDTIEAAVAGFRGPVALRDDLTLVVAQFG
jgi:sigma-B regulation protein RsbU (phosphoserine phosphatase)